MATLVNVPAIKEFLYQGRTIHAGESVTMEPVEAAIHARAGNVSLTRDYQRRDMTPATSTASADGSPAGSRRRRNYRRRDMHAEGE